MLRACRAVEEAGLPAFAIVSTGFLRQAEATARTMGISYVPIIEYPGVIPNDAPEVFDRKMRVDVFPKLLAAFSAPVERDGLDEADPDPDEVVFVGSLDEVQEEFLRRDWSDGLPVVPPTPDRVARFLDYTDRDPAEIIGIPLPELREATVHSVAVNGVMAGCRPEYLPILLAAVEAICDPEFRIEDAGSTPGWEPLVVVSGRLVDALGFNTEAGAMRVGRQANSSIGRFLRLYFRNVVGFRIPPGGTDKGSIGYSFNVALGENEGAVRVLGWPSFREDRGFDAGEDVVTVQSVVAISPPIYSGGSTALEHVETITDFLTTTCGPWAYTGIKYGKYYPLVVMSPSVAQGFADDGWTKDDIRCHLSDHVQLEAGRLERYALHVEGAEMRLADYVARGIADPRYAASDDPKRLVPLLHRPEWTGIVVAGDPGRNQCRVYANNHEQGPPVSKAVRLPDDYWDRIGR